MSERIAVDLDYDSAIEIPLDDSLNLSLRSSLLHFAQENGRTYHRLSEGNLQDGMYIITLDGKRALNPGAATAKRVLDMGTGTGIWALEFAEEHPAAEVIGVDLSPIQPPFVPPNCSFEIDDLEKEWTWTTPFDFIFSRMMTGSFSDPETIAKKAFNGLNPGGWYEIQDIQLPVFCDDGTLDPKTSPLMKWQECLIEGSRRLGRPLGESDKYKAIVKKVGFHNVVETRTWKWNLINFESGLEGVSLALFTRVLGWSKDEVISLCADVRNELRNPKVHGYWKIYVVYGQKPEKEAAW
ncbi:S-adenosyl-L-methionine-dependent methyltransferase [Fusarium oxysporum]|nr:S-adenosyl-L-methionine-dependent methyltransferase [Fusarium oxysporum]